MVFQRPNPFPKSVFDNVAYGPRVLGLDRETDLAGPGRAAWKTPRSGTR